MSVPLPSSPSSPSISGSAASNIDRVPVLIYTFITLHLLGSFLFAVILILTSFSSSTFSQWGCRRRERHPRIPFFSKGALAKADSPQKTTTNAAWKSFCISWIVFGLSYTTGTLISIGYGHGIQGMDRIAEDGGGPRAMCTIQAGLIYAAPGLAGCTTVALIIQLRSVMLFGMGRIRTMMSSFALKILVVIPWVLWLITLTAILIFALTKPSLLEMNNVGTYCHLKTAAISRVIACWFTVLLFIAIGVESYLVILMYKRGFRLAGQCDASRTALRLAIFMLQAIAMLGFSVAFIFMRNRGVTMDIMIAVQSPFAGILFGLRTRLLCCSKRRKEEELINKMGHDINSSTSLPTTSSINYRQHPEGLV